MRSKYLWQRIRDFNIFPDFWRKSYDNIIFSYIVGFLSPKEKMIREIYFSNSPILLFLLRDGSANCIRICIIPRIANREKRNKSRRKSLRGKEPRDQKSPRILAAPPASKISEILEPLAFLKDSKISEMLGNTQEPFQR